MYYLCNENKGADQFCGITAKLICVFVFAYAKRLFSHDMAHLSFHLSSNVYKYISSPYLFFCTISGNEFPAIVEFSPFQKVPKRKAKKLDSKKGTIEQGSKLTSFHYFISHKTSVSFKYRKVPKFLDTRKLRCNLPKIQTKRPNLSLFRQKDANGIAYSEDPDQTAPLGAV